MIGIAYCGITGAEAVWAEGTFLGAVTCEKCKRSKPDSVRFRGQPIPFTVFGRKTVHAGTIHTALDLGRHLDNLAVEALFCVFGEEDLKRVTVAIASERAVVDAEHEREVAVAQAVVDKERATEQAARAKVERVAAVEAEEAKAKATS